MRFEKVDPRWQRMVYEHLIERAYGVQPLQRFDLLVHEDAVY